jgi:hypothetical protein
VVKAWTELCSNFLFWKFLLLWDNVEEYVTDRHGTNDNKIRHLRFKCWLDKAIDTNSECVLFIAFPRQQYLRKLTTILQLYVHCLKCFAFSLANRSVWIVLTTKFPHATYQYKYVLRNMFLTNRLNIRNNLQHTRKQDQYQFFCFPM